MEQVRPVPARAHDAITVVGGLLFALAVVLAATGAPFPLPCLALAAACSSWGRSSLPPPRAGPGSLAALGAAADGP